MRPCHVPLAMLLLVAGSGPAAAEILCRAVLNDGRVILSEPLRGVNGLSCPELAPRIRPEFGNRLPSMSFTTGSIGPFTTGSLPPVTTGTPPATTGSLPPLTTFSNSHPAAEIRR
jgi:hypothetical protein